MRLLRVVSILIQKYHCLLVRYLLPTLKKHQLNANFPCLGHGVRDFPISHRQILRPGQAVLAALLGSGGFAQIVYTACALGVLLRVLRPQSTRD